MSGYSKLLQLGFAEDEGAEWLVNRYFPSKIGGKPAWLELAKLPTKEQLTCKKCEKPKAFICQVYAPFEEFARCFHRTIYIFMCRTASCNVQDRAENITVLRSQLGMRNDFFSDEPPDDGPEDEPLPAIEPQTSLCYACGCPGPLTCGNCKKINYCSDTHQRIHWSHHKYECKNKPYPADHDESNILSTILFAEYEIGLANQSDLDKKNKNKVDDEDDDDEDDSEEKERARIAEYEKLLAAGKTGVFQNVSHEELEKYCETSLRDDTFTSFKKVVSRHPYQVIRYSRDGKILWITWVNPNIASQTDAMPCCELCGSARQFEFQIMPSMLTLLKDDNIDWGIIAVFTCSNSCAINGYVTEVAVKQDI